MFVLNRARTGGTTRRSIQTAVVTRRKWDCENFDPGAPARMTTGYVASHYVLALMRAVFAFIRSDVTRRIRRCRGKCGYLLDETRSLHERLTPSALLVADLDGAKAIEHSVTKATIRRYLRRLLRVL